MPLIWPLPVATFKIAEKIVQLLHWPLFPGGEQGSSGEKEDHYGNIELSLSAPLHC